MDDLNRLTKKLDAVDLNDFERESLIPRIIDCMRFYRESFNSLLPICDNPENALLIDAVVRQAVANPAIDPSVPTPQAGQIYLAQAKQQIQTHWIAELDKFLADYPDPSAVKTGKDLFRLGQRAQQLAGSIVWCKTRLLSFSLRSFPVIINKRTGETMSGPSNEIEIIVYPFLGVLNELESSASSLIETLRDWGRSKKEARKDYVAYLTALEQIRLAKVLNWFQILVIIFAIVLTLSSNALIDLAKTFFAWISTLV
jgi:hypothetical protein